VAQKFPGSRVAILSEGGHSLQWEQPEAFNNAVLDFIKTNAAR
jgi:pimeloyl-ACP methyl ester carboxylesterase